MRGKEGDYLYQIDVVSRHWWSDSEKATWPDVKLTDVWKHVSPAIACAYLTNGFQTWISFQRTRCRISWALLQVLLNPFLLAPIVRLSMHPSIVIQDDEVGAGTRSRIAITSNQRRSGSSLRGFYQMFDAAPAFVSTLLSSFSKPISVHSRPSVTSERAFHKDLICGIRYDGLLQQSEEGRDTISVHCRTTQASDLAIHCSLYFRWAE